MSWIKPNFTMGNNKNNSLDSIKKDSGISILDKNQSRNTVGGNTPNRVKPQPTRFLDRFKWNFNPSSGDVPQ
jgi:hypothetical protein